MKSQSRGGPRRLGVIDAVAIIIGIIVGSGIFVAPAGVARVSSNFFVAAGLWFLAAAVAAAGALSYAECSSRLPRDGGFFVFYREAFGEWLGFTGGWAAQLVTYPASIAALAHLCANYAVAMVPSLSSHTTLLSILVIALSGGLNALGLRSGANAQRLLTAVKVLALVGLCLAGLVFGTQSLAVQVPTGDGMPGIGTLLGTVLVLLWTYDGWSDVSLIAGEIRDPGRNLVRAVSVSMVALAALYVLVQAAVMSALPASIAGASTSVFSDAMVAAIGPEAGALVALLVVVSTFGSLHGIIFTVCRLGPSMAKEGDFFSWFAAVDESRAVPRRSLGLVTIASGLYAAVAGFEELLRFFGQTVWIFYGLTGVALFIFRKRRVGEATAVRVPTVAPIGLVCASVAVTVALAIEDPRTFAAGVGMVGLGIPTYFFWIRVRGPKK